MEYSSPLTSGTSESWDYNSQHLQLVGNRGTAIQRTRDFALGKAPAYSTRPRSISHKQSTPPPRSPSTVSRTGNEQEMPPNVESTRPTIRCLLPREGSLFCRMRRWRDVCVLRPGQEWRGTCLVSSRICPRRDKEDNPKGKQLGGGEGVTAPLTSPCPFACSSWLHLLRSASSNRDRTA